MRKLSLLVVAMTAVLLPAGVHAMKPGLWEITSEMSSGGTPARKEMSEEQRKKMEAMGIKMPAGPGGGMGMVTKQCVTKEQAAKRRPPQSDENRREKCEQKDMKVSGNTTTWRVECTGERKMTGTGSITLQGDESYHGESTFNMQDPKRGPMTMKQSFKGKWLSADCKPKP